jgi:lysozyme
VNISEKGKSLIKSFESLELKAYKCSANVWTIGYGHTKNVKQDDVITEAQADCYLMQDLYETEKAINKLVRVPLSQNQYDALCSLVFNIGSYAFSKSTLLAKLNVGDYVGASEQFRGWNKITQSNKKIISAGLVRRRQTEEDLFNA